MAERIQKGLVLLQSQEYLFDTAFSLTRSFKLYALSNEDGDNTEPTGSPGRRVRQSPFRTDGGQRDSLVTNRGLIDDSHHKTPWIVLLDLHY